jgi:VWFA-related protein
VAGLLTIGVRTQESVTGDTAVAVSAVVTDAKGQIVRGLKASDFDVLVDGKAQALDGVELIRREPSAPRAFAFILDEFHTASGDSAAVRDELLRFVDATLRDGDLALVVKPLDALTDIKLTGDRAAIRRAIASFDGRKGDYTPRTAFERDYMAQTPAAVAAGRAQIVTSALRAVGTSLSRRNTAQPAIILVSDGFGRLRSSRELPADLQTAVRIANRADAPVYAFAPSLTLPREDGDSPVDPGFIALRALTAATGGALFTGTAEIAPGLARMVRDLDSHYVLRYRPAHGNDGRFHVVQVTAKRTGVTVNARTGYVAPMAESIRASLTPPPPAPTRVLRRSAFIQSWSGTAPIADGRAAVMLTWEPTTANALGVTQKARASTVVVTALAPDNSVLFDGGVGPASESPSPNVPNHASFVAPAGRIRVDMKILDAMGVVLDTDARDITVPGPPKAAPIIYPPAVFRTRSAREFRQVTDDPDAAPVPTRDFRRTERLLVRVAAIGIGGGSTPISAVLLNQWRQPMRDVAPMSDQAPEGVTQFDVPLSGLAPGEYTLRLTVNGPKGVVAEHVTFRVQS